MYRLQKLVLTLTVISEKVYLAMWLIFALLSAFFAAVTSILSKIGFDGVNSNLATAI